MSATHRRRGVVTERMLVEGLRGLGWPGAERSVRTGYRTAERELPDVGDVDGTPGIVWQVKSLSDKREGRSPTAAAELAVPEWMIETERQRKAAGADVGVLVLRRDRRPVAEWWVFIPLADLGDLIELERYDRIGGPPRSGGLVPVRLLLGDLCTLLHAAGYGEPVAA